MRQVKDYLCPSRYPEDYQFQLSNIRRAIYDQLKDYTGFDGLDFTDVNSGCILIRGFHKEIDNTTYGDLPHLKYDLSNTDEVIEEFVQMWKRLDNEKDVEDIKRFNEANDRWGWN